MTTGHLPVPMTPEQMQAWTLQRELDERNRPMTDDEIEALLPSGYKVDKDFISYLLWAEVGLASYFCIFFCGNKTTSFTVINLTQ